MKVTMVKPDALIEVKVGTGFLKKIQGVFIHLLANKTEEELATLSKELEKQEESEDEWIESVKTLSILIRTLEEEAIKQNLVYEDDYENVIKEKD